MTKIKWIAMALIMALMLALLTGCGEQKTDKEDLKEQLLVGFSQLVQKAHGDWVIQRVCLKRQKSIILT